MSTFSAINGGNFTIKLVFHPVFGSFKQINLDGNQERSCLNPLPNGQTGKLYQTKDLEDIRQAARDFINKQQPKFNQTKGKPAQFLLKVIKMLQA